MTFHIGQKVVCVGDVTEPAVNGYDCHGIGGEILPSKGEVYAIRDIAIDPASNGCCVVLAEIQNPARWYFHYGLRLDVWGEAAWSARHFRPVKTTSIEVFRAMLKPTPTKQREAA